MKNIDIKSVIIGVLATVLIIVSMGATNQDENLGDIVVNSITVVNENGETVAGLFAGKNGGMVGVNNADGKLVALLAADKNDHGMISVYNKHGKPAALLIADESGGNLFLYNNDGKPAAILNAAEFGGDLGIYNKHEKKVATLQANKNSDGAIGLYDRYGDLGWAESGKQ
jgi:hypothetical protein